MSRMTMADLVQQDIIALRMRGLSYKAIGEACAHFKGVPLTENQVRLKLRALGFGANPNMARPPRSEVTA